MSRSATLGAWWSLREWLASHAPEALDRLHGPADPSAIAAAERVIGASFPAAYREWLALHDGAEQGVLPDEISTVEEVVSTWRMRSRLLADGTFARVEADATPEIRSVWWHTRWVPITGDGAGNSLCIDLDPGPSGAAGQVIRFWHDHPRRKVEATSFVALFEHTLRDLREGRLVVVESHDTFHGLMPRDQLTGSLAMLRIRGEDDATYRHRARDEAQRSPAYVAVSLASTLRAYELLVRDDDVEDWQVAITANDAASAVSSLKDLAPVLHAALSRRKGVRLAIDLDRLRAVIDAFPFVDEVLGPPPRRRRRPPPRAPDPIFDPGADPIESLLDHLTTAGKPPLAWTVRHAADGSLGGIWNACARPRLLLSLAARVTERTTLVAAMCAALRALRSDDELRVHPGLIDSLEIAERWSRGEISTADASAAFDAKTSSLHGGSGKYLRVVIEAPDAVRAAANVSNAIDFVADDENAQRAAADVVRLHVRCPTLAELMEAYA